MFFSAGVYLTRGSLKPRPNDRNIQRNISQGATCCVRLANLFATCWVLLVLAIVWLELAKSERTILRYDVFWDATIVWLGLKKTTTGTATGTSLNKMFNEQHNVCAYNSWYISLSPSAKQQREMTKFCVFWRTWTMNAIFWNFFSKFIAAFQI